MNHVHASLQSNSRNIFKFMRWRQTEHFFNVLLLSWKASLVLTAKQLQAYNTNYQPPIMHPWDPLPVNSTLRSQLKHDTLIPAWWQGGATSHKDFTPWAHVPLTTRIMNVSQDHLEGDNPTRGYIPGASHHLLEMQKTFRWEEDTFKKWFFTHKSFEKNEKK